MKNSKLFTAAPLPSSSPGCTLLPCSRKPRCCTAPAGTAESSCLLPVVTPVLGTAVGKACSYSMVAMKQGGGQTVGFVPSALETQPMEQQRPWVD